MVPYRFGDADPSGDRRRDHQHRRSGRAGPLAELQVGRAVYPFGIEATQFGEQVGTHHPRCAGHRLGLEVVVVLALVELGVGDHGHRRAEGVEPPTHLLELPVRTDDLGPDHRGIGLHGSLHQATYRGVPEDNRPRNEEEEARIGRRRVGRRPRPETGRHRRATTTHPGRLNDQ